MKPAIEVDRRPAQPLTGQSRVSLPRSQSRSGAIFLLLCSVAMGAQQGQQAGQQQTNPTTPAQDPGLGRAWTTSPQIAISAAQAGQSSFDAANVERRKQITDDSAKLLKMATDLKTEVDKTTKDTLSISVIRKADEIEKLAHSVKEKMRLSTESK